MCNSKYILLEGNLPFKIYTDFEKHRIKTLLVFALYYILDVRIFSYSLILG